MKKHWCRGPKPLSYSVLAGAVLFAAAASLQAQASLLPVPGTEKRAETQAKLPGDVDVYAAENVGQNGKCLVGARTDQDGMNERPVVYLSGAGGFAWHAQLRMPQDVYQGRATHCVGSHGALYVLVQMDTDSHALTDQTLLEVVRLDERTGLVTGSSGFIGPKVAVPYTAWVEDGAGNFKLDGDKLVISGKYDVMSDWSDPGAQGSQTRAFAVALVRDMK